MGIDANTQTLIFLFRSWLLIHYKFYVSLRVGSITIVIVIECN